MIRKILVPMDGSPTAETILPNLRELAGVFGAQVVLMRVAFALAFPGADPTDAQVRTTGEAKAYLEKIGEELEADGFEVETVVRYGFPAEEILAHEAREDIDMTAMSTHGRRGPARWVLGSVAEEVLRHATKPIFLFRATKVAEPQPAAAEALSGAGEEG